MVKLRINKIKKAARKKLLRITLVEECDARGDAMKY
jgi:hypothetical protein